LGLKTDENKPYGDIKVGYKKFIRENNYRRQYGSKDSNEHG
jgi:hypothetical protein